MVVIEQIDFTKSIFLRDGKHIKKVYNKSKKVFWCLNIQLFKVQLLDKVIYQFYKNLDDFKVILEANPLLKK